MSKRSNQSRNYDADALQPPMAELLGLASGLMADRELSDSEILFLKDWLDKHHSISSSFPGSVIHGRINDVLEDGLVTEDERQHLVETLDLLIQGRLDDLAEQLDLTELWFDEIDRINFQDSGFCLTGNFVYGTRDACKLAIEQRGGYVYPKIEAEPQFLVVGGLGVPEWRNGGLGMEIEAAVQLKKKGSRLKIIPEDSWVVQL